MVRRNRFLYHLVYERYFLVAVVVLLFVGLALAVLIPKVWIVTPRGFDPEVKVRGLDFVQEASLRRSALQAEKAADFKDAMLSWRGAVENNPGNPENIRSALTNVTRITPPPKQWLGWSYHYGEWLLRLGRTNQSDVVLFARVLGHFELDESVVSLLSPLVDTLRGDQLGAYLKSLFELGMLERFNDVWTRNERELGADPELTLYRAAYLAGWGSTALSSTATARRTLENAQSEASTRLLANRLMLSVAAARNELATYSAALTRIETEQADRMRDHVRYWLLLAGNRKVDDAKELAIRYVVPPKTPADASLMTRALIQLSLRNEALKFLEKYKDSFDYSPTIWVLHSQLLSEAGRWEDLKALAVNVRQRDRLAEYLGGYHHFLEGLAEYRLDRQDHAREAFRGLTTNTIRDPVLAYTSAMTLNKLGQSEVAAQMLSRLENTFSNRLEFWLQLQAAAYDSRQFDLLLAATRKAYEINPRKLEYRNNYAAALLEARQDSGKAIQLTMDAWREAPRAFETRVNHAMALLQNARMDEAEPILRDLDDERSDAQRDTIVSMAWFEFYLGKGDTNRALEAATRVQERVLLPPQIEWFRKARSRLEPRK